MFNSKAIKLYYIVRYSPTNTVHIQNDPFFFFYNIINNKQILTVTRNIHIVTGKLQKYNAWTKNNGTKYKNKNTKGEKEDKTIIITIIIKNNDNNNKKLKKKEA